MQLPATSRHARVRRLLAVSAAAVAVMIGPTACDYGSYGGSSSRGSMDDMPGMNHGSDNQQHIIVPVGNTTDTTTSDDPTAEEAAATTTTEAAAAETTTTEAAAAEERRRGRDGRRRGDRRPRTSATIPVPTNPATAAPGETPAAGETPGTAVATASASAPPSNLPNNGLDVLGRDCSGSNLPAHTGFQSADAQCVSTAMGEVAAEDQLPSLLITNAPRKVGVGQPFQLVISTRNLKRDRFLGAAAGGYYLESSFLDEGGLQRGHFHTACRILPSTSEAPESSGTPAFFLATQDNGGGAAPDSVTIDVPATATATEGVLQCTSWAGDGSHRTPMMSRANQTPAMDSVRIFVDGRDRAEQNVSAADAQADAAKQAQAEQAEAAEQAPDQDGAVQPLPAGVGTAGASSPATTTEAAETAATSTTADAPAEN
jgi:hypothetical protein